MDQFALTIDALRGLAEYRTMYCIIPWQALGFCSQNYRYSSERRGKQRLDHRESTGNDIVGSDKARPRKVV